MEDSCALCEKRAMMLCDSDQAKLCWECDEKVHSANFLVAKHSRVLLCRFCHSQTPWMASGTKLTPTVSFCHRCVAERHVRLHQLLNNNDDVDVVDDGIDDLEGMLPMSSSSATSPSSGGAVPSTFKRLRNNSFSVDSHDETLNSSSYMFSATLTNSNGSTTSLTVLKRQRDRDD